MDSAQPSTVEVPQEEEAPAPEEAPPPPPPPEIIEFDLPTPNPGVYYIVYLPFTLKFMLFVIGFAAVNLGCTGVFGSRQYVAYYADLTLYRRNLSLTFLDSDNFTWFCEISKEVHKELTEYMKSKDHNITDEIWHKHSIVSLGPIGFYQRQNALGEKGYDEYFVPPTPTPKGGKSRSASKPGKPSKNLTKEQVEWEEEKRVRAARLVLEGWAADHRRNCNQIAPSWVAVEYYFVAAAIACVALEFISLCMAAIFPDLTMRLRALDAGIHGALGILIMAGSISLFVGMQIEMDVSTAGVEEKIWDAKEERVKEERKYELRKKQLEAWKKENRLNDTEFKKHEKWAKFRRDQKIKQANYDEDINKLEIGFYEKVCGASLGFVNAALYFFSAPIIGRGLTSIPLK